MEEAFHQGSHHAIKLRFNIEYCVAMKRLEHYLVCSQLFLPRHIFSCSCRCCSTVSTGIHLPYSPWVRLPSFHNFWDRKPTACPMRRITTIIEKQSPLLLLHGIWRENKAGEHNNSVWEPLLRCRRLPIISQLYDVV